MTPGSLAPQSQAFFRVDPIHPLVPDRPAFTPEQHEYAAVAVAHPSLRQLHNAPSQRLLRITMTAVSIGAARDPQLPARSGHAHLVSAHQVAHDLALPDGLHHFF